MYDSGLKKIVLLIFGVSTPLAILGSIAIAFIRKSTVRKNVLMGWCYLPVTVSFIGCGVWYLNTPVERIPYQPVWLFTLIGAAMISLIFTPVWAFTALFSHNVARRKIEIAQRQ